MVEDIEVQAEFKETEVGLIPSDWEVGPIEEFTRLISGQHILSQNYNNAWEGMPYLTGPADFGLVNPIVSKWTKFPKSIALSGDILITVKGDGVGKINLNNLDRAAISRQLMAIRPQNINGVYLYQYLRSKYNHFQDLSTGSTVPGLSRENINKHTFALPPTLAEQTAIAKALNDADALITQLEKLIAKKRAIKHGTMQKLLKPKEGWEVKRLREYVLISSGESPSKFNFIDSGIPYFKVEQLNNSTKYAKETIYYIDSTSIIPKGSIIFPKRGASIFLNKIRILGNDSYMDTNLMTLTCSEELNNEYLFYQLSYIGLGNIADTTSIPQINNKHINPFLIPFPKSKKEQTQIAQILSDIDMEIWLLEKKLAKYQLVKQGMMQNLLTGKIRLV